MINKVILFITGILLSIHLNAQTTSSCSDGVKNGHEVDIDCGGPCEPCANGIESGVLITVDNTDEYPFKHTLWLPEGYDYTNEYLQFPLIVFMHGNGQLNSTVDILKNHGPMKHRNDSWWDYPFIIVNPLREGSILEEDLDIFINQITDEYHVDESRIYITGLSGGSFRLASYVVSYPDKMAAIASIAGYTPNIKPVCLDFKGTPLWYFHNIGDPTVTFNYGDIDEFGDLHESCGQPQPDPYIFLSIFDSSPHDSWSRVYNPFLNQGNAITYSSQYDLADISYLTDDIAWDDTDYNIYQTPFGIPNGVEPIYDWFLKYENVPNNCRNQVMDNDETGIDCGGSCKPCTTTYNCHNGVLDEGETAIDCGGNCPVCERELFWKNTSWNNVDEPISTDNVTILETFSGAFTCNNLTISQDVTFTVNGTLDVKGNLINNGTLIVSSGSSIITYEGQSVSENIIVKRNTRYADGKYSFVGTPVESTSDVTRASLGDYVYSYEESSSDESSKWVIGTNNELLIPGRGYTQADLQLIEFTGRPNTGTITYPASYTNDGWHLVSNPYAAAISIDEFLDANQNTTGAIYIWDDNDSQVQKGLSDDYIVVNKIAVIDVNGPQNESRWNGYIGSVQGFFVQLSESSGNITFNEGMRAPDNNSDENFFRKIEETVLKVNLTNSDGLVKQMAIGWNENISNQEVTSGFDAPVQNKDADYSIYSFKSGQELIIQTINEEKNEIELGYHVPESGFYSMSFIFNNQNDSYYLIDKLEGIYTSIANENSYTFSSFSGQFTDRFSIVREEEILSLDNNKSTMIYTFDKTLYILLDNNPRAIKYALYNIQGKIVEEIYSNESLTIDLKHLPNGVYLISDGTNSQKVILR